MSPFDRAWALLKYDWQQDDDDEFVCELCGFRTHDEEVFAYHDCLPVVGGLHLPLIRDLSERFLFQENYQ